MHWEFISCSAWANKSAATQFTLENLSATTVISDGPATISIPTSPKTSFLAAETKIFPGPTILLTFLIFFVPYVMAAIAWAPPIEKISLMPTFFAAYKTPGLCSPFSFGLSITILLTLAIFAGIAFIKTVDGKLALPPGT